MDAGWSAESTERGKFSISRNNRRLGVEKNRSIEVGWESKKGRNSITSESTGQGPAEGRKKCSFSLESIEDVDNESDNWHKRQSNLGEIWDLDCLICC